MRDDVIIFVRICPEVMIEMILCDELGLICLIERFLFIFLILLNIIGSIVNKRPKRGSLLPVIFN